MATETQDSKAGSQSSQEYLRRFVISAVAAVWGAFWIVVAMRIYAQRAALSSGLGETSIVGAISTLLLVFVAPAVYIIVQQVHTGLTTA